MQTRRVKILGTGVYLPKTIVTAEEIDRRAGLRPGWTEKHSGVVKRHFAGNESAPFMGARAVEAALANAGITLAEVDCIVCTSGTMAQPIPCTAALIKEELRANENFPAMDFNLTCLSFLAGLDAMSYLVAAGRYQCVVLVAAEIASRGLDWDNPETCSILGDGAAAAVIVPSNLDEPSQILAARVETFTHGAHTAEIRGGGSSLPANRYNEQNHADYLFYMDGRAVFRLALEILPDFVERLMRPLQLDWRAFQVVIPHQASLAALRLMQRRLGIPEDKFFVQSSHVGNTIAASIPMALHFAREAGRLRRGDKTLLIGTSAGFSVGAMALDF